jgi:hypothetical protein
MPGLRNDQRPADAVPVRAGAWRRRRQHGCQRRRLLRRRRLRLRLVRPSAQRRASQSAGKARKCLNSPRSLRYLSKLRTRSCGARWRQLTALSGRGRASCTPTGSGMARSSSAGSRRPRLPSSKRILTTARTSHAATGRPPRMRRSPNAEPRSSSTTIPGRRCGTCSSRRPRLSVMTQAASAYRDGMCPPHPHSPSFDSSPGGCGPFKVRSSLDKARAAPLSGRTGQL